MLDDEKCLCGSGRMYGICCKPFSGMKIEDYKRELESKNYNKSILHSNCHADGLPGES